jgi:hypothetical protein
LVTALEVLLMGPSESLGKRSKVSKRVARVVSAVRPDANGVEEKADELYRLRSECLHEGLTQIEETEVNTAYDFVAAVIQAYMTKEPYCKCPDLAAVLCAIEPPCGLSYQI